MSGEEKELEQVPGISRTASKQLDAATSIHQEGSPQRSNSMGETAGQPAELLYPSHREMNKSGQLSELRELTFPCGEEDKKQGRPAAPS